MKNDSQHIGNENECNLHVSPQEHACNVRNDNKNTSETISVNTNVSREESTTLQIFGMDCADEVEAVERALRTVRGIAEFKVNLMAGKVSISHERVVTAQQLIEAIRKVGLKSELASQTTGKSKDASAQNIRVVAVAAAGIFTGTGLILQWTHLFSPTWEISAFILGIISGGWFIAPKTLRALRQFSLDMNVLMTVAVIGACAIGAWSEGAAVVFLFGFSEVLEALSLNRARRAIQSLLAIAPETALVKRGNQFIEVAVIEVVVGDTVIVRSGAKVPLDGQVITGQSSVNQASITGESMPVEKAKGDGVFAGTINGEGSLEILVTKPYSESTLSKIIHLVEEAQSQKAPSQRFVDRFAKIYTPAVFILSIAVMLIPTLFVGGSWEVWIYRALALMVIACPCALVISTPVSIVSGLTAMARRGVLIKGGVFLEAIGKLKALAVDKTGTITEGKPRVVGIISVNGNKEEDIIRIAACIDMHSDHPIAQAVIAYANERKVQFLPSENYRSQSGFGAEARIDGHDYFVGNHRFAHDLGLCSPELEKTLERIEGEAKSVVVVGHKSHDGHQGEVMGVLAVADKIRPIAASAVLSLHQQGLENVVMLSGDNQRTVNAISKEAGIDEAHGGLLPDDKIRYIRELVARYQYVGMIGDGVNDAPAMAAATVGIVMGGVGSDAAIETADIVLMQDDLSQVAVAIALGQRTVGIIRANIIFALGVKAIFLMLALFGYTSLWLAILADTGATLIVIANALRLLSLDARSKVTSEVKVSR